MNCGDENFLSKGLSSVDGVTPPLLILLCEF